MELKIPIFCNNELVLTCCIFKIIQLNSYRILISCFSDYLQSECISNSYKLMQILNRLLQQEEGEEDQETHCNLLTIMWIAANIVVLFSMFKFSKYTFWIHAILSGIIIILTVVGSLILLVPKGYYYSDSQDYRDSIVIDDFHNIMGTILTCWLLFQIVTGIFARTIQQGLNTQPLTVILVKRTHRFFSYAILIMGAIQLLNKRANNDVGAFWALLVFQIIFLIVYFGIKFFYPTLSEKISDFQIKKQSFQIKQISSQNEIPNNIQYCVFSDYVYDLAPLKGQHPGGQLVIEMTKFRQIDRFLYGMYFVQSITNVAPVEHTAHSMFLLGEPIAKIKRNQTMKGLNQLNKCSIKNCQLISQSSETFLINLTLQDTQLYYQGYQTLDQFGQYFAFNIDKKVTRLYTTVFCMRSQNLNFMQHYFPGSNKLFIKKSAFKKQDYQMQMTELMTESNKISTDKIKQNQSIPLLIKKYDTGKLTSHLFKNQEQLFEGEITLSCLKGSGMKLQQIKEGKIIIVSGGTGLYPFIDFIDILFKKAVSIEESNLKQKIYLKDPVVKNIFLENKQFLFLIAANSVLDLPSISLFQLNYLAGSKNINLKCKLKCKKDQKLVKVNYQNIQIVNQRFNDKILGQLKFKPSKIFICGPPAMNAYFALLFQKQKVDLKEYQMM